MVVCSAAPDTGASGGATPPSRTMCPSALTSTNRTPSAPRRESSYSRSSPVFPMSEPSRRGCTASCRWAMSSSVTSPTLPSKCAAT